MDEYELAALSKKARNIILEMKYRSGSSHIGSAFSVVDLLVYLYFSEMNFPDHPVGFKSRDSIILSKGHAGAALYSVLALKGYIPKEWLNKYYCDNGILPGHIDSSLSPYIDVSSGSLGHGLSVGAGIALASPHKKVAVILGDGELDEGSVWEALNFIIRMNLTNLLVIIDSNQLQGLGSSEEIFPVSRYQGMLDALGYDVRNLNGHDFLEMKNQFGAFSGNKVIAVIASTIKGKGVSFMENSLDWHYRSPNLSQRDLARDEMDSGE